MTASTVPCLFTDGREQCGALLPDTEEARRIHRSSHAQDKKVKDAFRSAIKDRDETIRELKHRLQDLEEAVEKIRTAEPPEQLQINEWPDDEPDPEPSLEDLDLEQDDEPLPGATTSLADYHDIITTPGIDPDITPTYGPGAIR